MAVAAEEMIVALAAEQHIATETAIGDVGSGPAPKKTSLPSLP